MSATFDDEKPVYKNPRNIAIAAVTLVTVVAVGYYFWPCRGCAVTDQDIAKIEAKSDDVKGTVDAAVVDAAAKVKAETDAAAARQKEEEAKKKKAEAEAARLKEEEVKKKAAEEEKREGWYNIFG